MTTLLAATGDGVARIVRDGAGWRAATALAGSGAQCLAPDPAAPGIVYAGCRGSGVARSDDGGGEWRRLAFRQDDVFSLAVSPVDGTVYAGCEPTMLFASRDGGETWQELAALRDLPSAPTWSFPPRPWTSHVRWIAPSPHDAGLLLVGIELGGLMRSEDGGATWADHRPGAQRDVHALAWHPREPGRAYEAAGGGAAWSAADGGRDRHYTWALAVDPADPDCWWISASTGPLAAHRNGNADAFLYRWRGQGPWKRLDGGLPQPLDSMPYALVGPAPELYAGLADGQIYASVDRGDSWDRLELDGEPLSSVTALALV